MLVGSDGHFEIIADWNPPFCCKPCGQSYTSGNEHSRPESEVFVVPVSAC